MPAHEPTITVSPTTVGEMNTHPCVSKRHSGASALTDDVIATKSSASAMVERMCKSYWLYSAA